MRLGENTVNPGRARGVGFAKRLKASECNAAQYSAAPMMGTPRLGGCYFEFAFTNPVASPSIL